MKQQTVMKKMMVLISALLLSVACVTTAWAARVRLPKVEDTYWDEEETAIARWDEVEDAYQYEIYLYRNESRVETVKTKKTYYDFEKKLTREGDYTFKVRALAKSSSKEYNDSYWSEESDSIYVSESYAELIRNGGKIDTENSGPGANGTQKEPVKESSVVYTPQWIEDATGWWYRFSDGSYPANAWWQDPATGIWYFFNEQGYMVTGWVDWNGNRYYCLPSGAMVTGTTTIDGVTCQFDASGALQAS